jgi:dipeptidyl aminopeptidase/acylaminoacyl peptidase
MKPAYLSRAGLLAAALLCQTIAFAAPPPVEAFYNDADIVAATLSPSGRQLAITTARGAERVGLAVFDLGSGKMTRAAHFSDGDVAGVQWVNDQRLVFGVTDYSQGSGRPDAGAGLFAVNPDGEDLRLLIHRSGGAAATGTKIVDRTLDWAHALLTVPLPRRGEVNEDVLVVDRRVQRPLWLNTRTGQTRPTGITPPSDVAGWLADARGELRVALTQRDGRTGALWRAPDSKAWQPLFDSPLLEAPFAPAHVDTNGQLYVTQALGKAGETVLSRYNFERNAPEPQPLVSTPGFDFGGSLLTDSEGRTVGVRVVTDAEDTVWFNPAMSALQKQADERLPGRVNRINCRRCGEADMVALVLSYSDREPGHYWLYQAKPPEGEAAWRSVGRLRNSIQPPEMARVAFHRIQARDGRDLPVWVTRPTTAAKEPLPAVVLVHGGPWVRGGAWQWKADAQFLASRGYVVIEPEFRGSTGYGDAHYKASFKQWGLSMQDDVTDALRWAQKQGLASDKACIIGASYGGYSTLMGLVRDPDLYRCGIAWLAVTDLELLVKGSWWVNDDTALARRYTIPDMIGDAEKDAAMLAANSPVRQAARIKAPVLLAFGEDDRRVPLTHGERMRRALQQAGAEPEWVTYPGEGHGFALARNRVDFAKRMEAFLARHLKP